MSYFTDFDSIALTSGSFYSLKFSCWFLKSLNDLAPPFLSELPVRQ